MKLLRALMLVYQYGFYSLLEIDKYLWKRTWGLAGTKSEKISRYKAKCVFLILESVALIPLYDLAVHLLLGFPLRNPQAPYPIGRIIVFGIVVVILTDLLVGPRKRTEHYGKIFAGWDKKKRLRWNISIGSTVVLIYVFLLLVEEAVVKRLPP
jgi:succinate dehydrogenase/fumarate reductase cytochrome b subunit